MRPKIAKWWLPDDVVFVDEIPHTATGKIQKTALARELSRLSLAERLSAEISLAPIGDRRAADETRHTGPAFAGGRLGAARGGLALPVLALERGRARASAWCRRWRSSRSRRRASCSACAALGLALYSLADIWISGAEGARVAIAGIVYASPVLVMLGLVAAAAIVYPRLTDVSTDLDDPPRFIAPGAAHGAPDASRSTVAASDAYPTIVPHLYPLPLGEVYRAARDVIVETRLDRHPRCAPGPSCLTPRRELPLSQAVAEDDEVTAALALKSVMTQSRSGMATETTLPPSRRGRSDNRGRRSASPLSRPIKRRSRRWRRRRSSASSTTSWCACRATPRRHAGGHALGLARRRARSRPECPADQKLLRRPRCTCFSRSRAATAPALRR